MKTRKTKLKKIKFSSHRYTSMILPPLFLGLALTVIISLLMSNQLQNFGEEKAAYFRARASSLFREVEIIASSITEDSDLARSISNEDSNYPLSLCNDLNDYKENSDFISSIYVICPDGVILSTNGRYTKESLPVILTKIGETPESFYGNDGNRSGWNIGTSGIVEPYYVTNIDTDRSDVSGWLLIVLNTSVLRSILKEDNVELCCIFNENQYISSKGSGAIYNGQVDEAISMLLQEKNIRYFVASSSEFNYLIAVSTVSFNLPVKLTILIFGIYLLIIIAIGFLQSSIRTRRDRSKASGIIEKLPKGEMKNPSYEEILAAVEEALTHYSLIEKSYQHERTSNFCRFILGGYAPAPYSKQLLMDAGILTECIGYHVAVLYIADYSDIVLDEQDRMESYEIALLILDSAFSSVASDLAKISCCRIDGNISVVFSHNAEDMDDFTAANIITETIQFLEENYGLSIQATLSPWLTEPSQLAHAYAQANDLNNLSRALDISVPLLCSRDFKDGKNSVHDFEWLKGIQVLTNALLLQKWELIPGLVRGVVENCYNLFDEDYLAYRNKINCLAELLSESVGGIGSKSEELVKNIAVLRSVSNVQELLNAVDSVFNLLNQKSNASSLGPIERSCSYIRENLSNPSLSVSLICEKNDISVQHLSKLFRIRLGKTMTEYINESRVDMAKTLIAQGKRSMAAIAEEVGYGSIDSFNRNFKKLEGITPTQYSKIIRPGNHNNAPESSQTT